MDISSTASAIFGPASAESFFGSTSAETIFAAGLSATGTSDQQSAKAIITAHKREVNRIRGYKIQLTPSDNKRLSELADKIRVIGAKAAAGTVLEFELDDRLEYLEEADRIIGKPIVDVEVDQKLAEFNALKVALLEPRLDNATAKRVEFLERYKDSLAQQINENPDRKTPQRQFQTASSLIETLKPLRLTTELSRLERKTYDDIVELINDHTGIKLELTAEESDRVIALERSIAEFQSALGPDPSQQPTSQAVANAYVSLSRR